MPAAKRLGDPLLLLEEAVSTNDVAKEHAVQGAAEGLVVVARRQTGGRGRRGRVWLSPPDVGLYFSALLRPGWPAVDAPWLGVMAGLAVWQAVHALGVAEARIKWPNDVLVNGRKLAGVLVEPRIAAGRIEFAVIGVGLNLMQESSDWPDGLSDTAISLRQLGLEVDRDTATFALCVALGDLYERACAQGVQALAAAWAQATGGERLPELA